jgi:hypothetical protein
MNTVLTAADACSTANCNVTAVCVAAGELLPDTIAAFSSPASLAALSNLRCLGISEAAMPGPAAASEWLAPLTALQQLQLVQLDEPGKAQRRARSTAGTSTCGTAAAAAGAAGSANSLANGLLCAGGFGALAAAAAGAGRNGCGTAEQLQALQQQQQQLQALLPGLQGQLATQQQQQQPQQHSNGGRLSNTSSGVAAAHSSGAGAGPVRTNSTGSNSDADSVVFPAGSGGSAGAAGAAAELPPLDLSGVLPSLSSLHVSNLAGERLVGLRIPSHLTRLALHLANPCPGAVTGEQLAAVVLQAAHSLVALELGLGLRFSLSGGVMRSLKRGLKSLRELTLVEGTQDHLEGLGCWCNLRHLELVEGRCSVPLRGLYELSMRAAMGRTPGVLRYCGHVRHVEELAGRLGGALQELRLDSLTGIGTLGRAPLLAEGSEGIDERSEAVELPPLSLQQQDEVLPSSPLAQLLSLTRLEICGERLGQLESSCGVALGNLRQLVVLEIVGQEAWLAPELGVKEQLGWLRGLSRLRQLRLAGVMLGRSKLAGTGGGSGAAGDGSRGLQDKGSTAGGRGSSSKAGSGSLVPAVKGLGNGLASPGSGSSSGSKAAAAPAPAPVPVPAMAAAVLDPAAAAARDLLVSVSMEELRRWLCQMLPYCRVWMD